MHADNYDPDTPETLVFGSDWSFADFDYDHPAAWYKLTLPSDGYLTISLTSNFTTCDMVLYDTSRTVKYFEYFVNGDLYEYKENTETVSMYAGTYYVRTGPTYPSNYEKGEKAGTGGIKVNFESAKINTTHENTSFRKARTIQSGEKVDGFFARNNAEDYYKIVLPSEGNLTLDVTTEAYCCVEVYNDENGKPKQTGYDIIVMGKGKNDLEREQKQVTLEAGTYYLKAFSSIGWDNNSDFNYLGRYSLIADFEAIDDKPTPAPRPTSKPTPKPTAKPAEEKTVTMYRAYNPYSGEHFYTSNRSEFNHIVSLGWRNEGTGWIAPAKSSTPVYRLYNKYGGEHHYTTNTAERNNLIKAGWKNEGIGWYSDDQKRTPLYREYNPFAYANNHNYTTSISENNYLVSLGWKYEGIGWYGVRAK